MIDETTLPSSEKKILRNRFYAAKNRAAATETAFSWETFGHWLTDFCALAPEDFNSDDYRLSYDTNAPEGYAPSSMRFAPSKKRRNETMKRSLLGGAATQPAQRAPSPLLAEVSELQRMLFTAELTLRLKNFQVDQTFEELVSEAAAAAGIELR
jgi:hypothetical protein